MLKNSENTQKRDEAMYTVWDYNGRGSVKRYNITEQQYAELDPTIKDFVADFASERLYLKDNTNCSSTLDMATIPNFGPVNRRFLTTIMVAAGIWLRPYQVGSNSEKESLWDRENVAAHILKLRKNIFQESKANAQFILSRSAPFKVAWNHKKTFLLIRTIHKSK